MLSLNDCVAVFLKMFPECVPNPEPEREPVPERLFERFFQPKPEPNLTCATVQQKENAVKKFESGGLEKVVEYLCKYVRVESQLKGNKKDGTEFPHDFKVEYFCEDFLLRSLRTINEVMRDMSLTETQRNVSMKKRIIADLKATSDVMTEFGNVAEPEANNKQDTKVEACLKFLEQGKGTVQDFFSQHKGSFADNNKALRETGAKNGRAAITSAADLELAMEKYVRRSIDRALDLLEKGTLRDGTTAIRGAEKAVLYDVLKRSFSWNSAGKAIVAPETDEAKKILKHFGKDLETFCADVKQSVAFKKSMLLIDKIAAADALLQREREERERHDAFLQALVDERQRQHEIALERAEALRLLGLGFIYEAPSDERVLRGVLERASGHPGIVIMRPSLPHVAFHHDSSPYAHSSSSTFSSSSHSSRGNPMNIASYNEFRQSTAGMGFTSGGKGPGSCSYEYHYWKDHGTLSNGRSL